jgi:hypothetical protein
MIYRLTVTVCLLALFTPVSRAQISAKAPKNLVDLGMMTWVEVKAAIDQGKTTALVYNGGTEQRGPQNVLGGHNLMGPPTVDAIALKLGNAIAAPVLPFSPNDASAYAALPCLLRNGLRPRRRLRLRLRLDQLTDQAPVNPSP